MPSMVVVVAAEMLAHPHQSPLSFSFSFLLSLSFSLFFNKEMELSLVGLQNAGKTSLVGVLATGAFQEVREGGIEREFFSSHRWAKNEKRKEKKRILSTPTLLFLHLPQNNHTSKPNHTNRT